MEISQKTKSRTTLGSSDFTARYRRWKHWFKKIYANCIVCWSTNYNCQVMETTNNRPEDKEDVDCIYDGKLLSYLKKCNLATCSNIEGIWRDYASELYQKETVNTK